MLRKIDERDPAESVVPRRTALQGRRGSTAMVALVLGACLSACDNLAPDAPVGGTPGTDPDPGIVPRLLGSIDVSRFDRVGGPPGAIHESTHALSRSTCDQMNSNPANYTTVAQHLLMVNGWNSDAGAFSHFARTIRDQHTCRGYLPVRVSIGSPDNNTLYGPAGELLTSQARCTNPQGKSTSNYSFHYGTDGRLICAYRSLGCANAETDPQSYPACKAAATEISCAPGKTAVAVVAGNFTGTRKPYTTEFGSPEYCIGHCTAREADGRCKANSYDRTKIGTCDAGGKCVRAAGASKHIWIWAEDLNNFMKNNFTNVPKTNYLGIAIKNRNTAGRIMDNSLTVLTHSTGAPSVAGYMSQKWGTTHTTMRGLVKQVIDIQGALGGACASSGLIPGWLDDASGDLRDLRDGDLWFDYRLVSMGGTRPITHLRAYGETGFWGDECEGEFYSGSLCSGSDHDGVVQASDMTSGTRAHINGNGGTTLNQYKVRATRRYKNYCHSGSKDDWPSFRDTDSGFYAVLGNGNQGVAVGEAHSAFSSEGLIERQQKLDGYARRLGLTVRDFQYISDPAIDSTLDGGFNHGGPGTRTVGQMMERYVAYNECAHRGTTTTVFPISCSTNYVYSSPRQSPPGAACPRFYSYAKFGDPYLQLTFKYFHHRFQAEYFKLTSPDPSQIKACTAGNQYALADTNDWEAIFDDEIRWWEEINQ